MKIGIVIPAHNEEEFIPSCLESFIAQSRIPDKLVIVNDNSTDRTVEIVQQFCQKYQWIELLNHSSTPDHAPGAKVVKAFKLGFKLLDGEFDLIGKFDADIVLPEDYLERVLQEFEKNGNLGLCSGLLYIAKGDQWVYESISSKSHVRGPIKLYSKPCLTAMNGLREGLGWDIADEILAEYHGYETKTIQDLKVRHLRPTGSSYSQSNSRKQGLANYHLRYGFWISFLAAAKMAFNKRNFRVLFESMGGYLEAKRNKIKPIVSREEGEFIRKYRYRKIKQALF